MPMVKCDSGHFYNPDNHGSCPYCRGVHLDLNPTVGVASPTVGSPSAFGGGAPSDATVGAGSTPVGGADPTMGADVYLGRAGESSPTTQPVVGWLVCIKGENLGRDYRIRPGMNTVGREMTNDVQVTGDSQISRESHAVLFFDHRSQRFVIYNDQGKNGTWVNGDIVLKSHRELDAYDRVVMGDTELLFLPLCGERFSWAQS